jgi:hypothetical protein
MKIQHRKSPLLYSTQQSSEERTRLYRIGDKLRKRLAHFFETERQAAQQRRETRHEENTR